MYVRLRLNTHSEPRVGTNRNNTHLAREDNPLNAPYRSWPATPASPRRFECLTKPKHQTHHVHINPRHRNQKIMKVSSMSSLMMSTLLLLGTTVHQARADCTIQSLNKAFQGLTVDVYDGLDGVCLDSSSSVVMDYDTCKSIFCHSNSPAPSSLQ